MNKINTKYVILAASIIGIILLSGCLGNDTSKTTPISNVTPVVTQSSPSVTETPVKNNISTNSNHTNNSVNLTDSKTLITSKSSSISTLESSNWCKSYESLTVNEKEFVVQGLVTDDSGTSLCYAKFMNSETNTTTKYYFSQDGKIKRMNSISISSNGNASALASSSVNIS